jgi:peptidoglycan/LPS O-acetylase OafA/YrhL
LGLQKTAGIAIILGVVVYVLAMFVSPRLYQEPDIGGRVNIIEENRSRWNISQVMFALGMGVTALGFLLLTLHLHGVHRQWTIYGGAASFIVGALLGVIFVYRQTFDPVQYWESARPSALIVGAVVLTLAGLLLYGIVFLQNDFPNWSGYIAVGAAVVLLVAFLLTRGTTGFVVASLSYLVTLIVGIILVR